MRERNIGIEVSKPIKSPRQPLVQAKACASRRVKQRQPKRQNIWRQNGLLIFHQLGYHLGSLLTSIGKNTNIHTSNSSRKIGVEKSTHHINHPRNKSIEIWLSGCAQLAEREGLLESPSEIMPSSARVFVLRRESLPTTEIAPSNKSRYRGKHFRASLGKRNIYIAREERPTELITRAKRIFSQPYDSSEMDDAIAPELERIINSIDTENENILIRELGLPLFPAIRKFPDQRLAVAVNRLWNHTVPIPLEKSLLSSPPALPAPRPDIAFGYSDVAFNKNQHAAIDLLVNEVKKSYAMPVQTVRFPFLLIEFKALGTGGSPFEAANQVAHAGAIAMNGLLELYRRNSAEADMDFDNPQCFSLTVNNVYASVNVHWLSHRAAEDGSICFNMVNLSNILLTESDGLKRVHQIVRNIVEYALSKRLPKFCEALDKYMQNILDEREKGEEQQLPRRQSGENGHKSAKDRRPAKRRKLGGPAYGDTAESDVDRPAQQSQSRRVTRSQIKKAPPPVR